MGTHKVETYCTSSLQVSVKERRSATTAPLRMFVRTSIATLTRIPIFITFTLFKQTIHNNAVMLDPIHLFINTYFSLAKCLFVMMHFPFFVVVVVVVLWLPVNYLQCIDLMHNAEIKWKGTKLNQKFIIQLAVACATTTSN